MNTHTHTHTLSLSLSSLRFSSLRCLFHPNLEGNKALKGSYKAIHNFEADILKHSTQVLARPTSRDNDIEECKAV